MPHRTTSCLVKKDHLKHSFEIRTKSDIIKVVVKDAGDLCHNPNGWLSIYVHQDIIDIVDHQFSLIAPLSFSSMINRSYSCNQTQMRLNRLPLLTSRKKTFTLERLIFVTRENQVREVQFVSFSFSFSLIRYFKMNAG